MCVRGRPFLISRSLCILIPWLCLSPLLPHITYSSVVVINPMSKGPHRRGFNCANGSRRVRVWHGREACSKQRVYSLSYKKKAKRKKKKLYAGQGLMLPQSHCWWCTSSRKAIAPKSPQYCHPLETRHSNTGDYGGDSHESQHTEDGHHSDWECVLSNCALIPPLLTHCSELSSAALPPLSLLVSFQNYTDYFSFPNPVPSPLPPASHPFKARSLSIINYWHFPVSDIANQLFLQALLAS